MWKTFSIHRRQLLSAIILVVIIYFCINHYYGLDELKKIPYNRYLQWNPTDTSSQVDKQPVQQTATCKYQHLDPWDERVKKYLHKVPPIECEQMQSLSFLTELTADGILRWNTTTLSSDDGGFKKWMTKIIRCNYQEFSRQRGNDDNLDYQPSNEFNGSVQLNQRFVRISCVQNKTEVYFNIHSWLPPIYYKHKPLSVSKSPSLVPNVLILILDGMSQPNFQRQLPNTYKVLMNEMRAVNLQSMVKSGSNTLPNLVALLTGHRFNGPTLPPRLDGYYFDPWPFAWKNFSRAGYVTIFTEDDPGITGFNYLEKGFSNAPTDVYNRPFWIALEKGIGKSKSHCFGNRAKHEILLSDLKKTLEVLNGRRFFAVAMMTEITHGSLNGGQVLESDLESFVRWFNAQYARDSILIVMGDHGMNFGDFRATELGRIEAARPFCSISVSGDLQKHHPHLLRNLDGNKERVTTWFDVYDTLMDVVAQQYANDDKAAPSPISPRPIRSRQRWSLHGSSLWYPIPETRSCADAGIGLEYCPCYKEIKLSYSVNNSDLVGAVKAMIDRLNDLVKVAEQCVILSVKRVNEVFQIFPDTNITNATDFKNVYRIVLETNPNDAVLEGLVKANSLAQFVPVGTIYRINAYGNSSWCVDDKGLKLYCACKRGSSHLNHS